jgi:DNA-binding MarR family transcriptional regulator
MPDMDGARSTDADAELFGPLNLAILRLGRAHRALASQLMREVGLRPEQGALMMHLWSVGAVRQTSLATRFGKDSAATTRTVQRMEKAGYLRRRADPSDGRATLVEPTPAGHALRSRVEQLWQGLERTTSEPLTESERSDALALIVTLGDSLTDRLHESPDPSLGDL